ncbi:MAG: hypothetical protein HQ542_04650 [Bacteroidia bacterium]|nr:hypothetical protein [Bacteroidia bacterium]
MSYNHKFDNIIEKYTDSRSVFPVIDMHVHFVDFVQTTDGFEKLLSSMKRGNIAKSVVFGLPVKKKWEFFEPHAPTYYLGDNAKCYYFSSSDELVA